MTLTGDKLYVYVLTKQIKNLGKFSFEVNVKHIRKTVKVVVKVNQWKFTFL